MCAEAEGTLCVRGRGLLGGHGGGSGRMGAADWASMTSMLVILVMTLKYRGDSGGEGLRWIATFLA